MAMVTTSERCVICGAEIPEGRMVCPICEKRSSHEEDDCSDCRNMENCTRYPCYCINGSAYIPRREF